MVVVLRLELRLGANLAHTVYKAVGATLHYTTMKLTLDGGIAPRKVPGPAVPSFYSAITF